MSDKFLPVPITIQNILYSASEASKEPLATFLKDLFEDIETLKKMDPQICYNFMQRDTKRSK